MRMTLRDTLKLRMTKLLAKKQGARDAEKLQKILKQNKGQHKKH